MGEASSDWHFGIILRAAEGAKTEEIRLEFGIRTATVSKWRTRFARQGLQGLHDVLQSGRRRKYGEETEHRILSELDMPPPRGETIWTGAAGRSRTVGCVHS